MTRILSKTLEVQKEKNYQHKLLYPVKISFKMQGIITTFSFESKIREFGTQRPTPKECQKKII